jgi:hypothetical protein
MPQVQPEYFPISLALEPAMVQQMLADLPRLLLPLANPSAAAVEDYHQINSQQAAMKIVRNESDTRVYCMYLLNTVAVVLQRLGIQTASLLADYYVEQVNVRMDYSVGIGGQSKVAAEVKTDLVFTAHEADIDDLVDVPWLGHSAGRNFRGALAIVMKVSVSDAFLIAFRTLF